MTKWMLEIAKQPPNGGLLYGWRCSDCGWEYRLDAPLRRDRIPLDTKLAAQQLHHQHNCADYGKS